MALLLQHSTSSNTSPRLASSNLPHLTILFYAYAGCQFFITLCIYIAYPKIVAFGAYTDQNI